MANLSIPDPILYTISMYLLITNRPLLLSVCIYLLFLVDFYYFLGSPIISCGTPLYLVGFYHLFWFHIFSCAILQYSYNEWSTSNYLNLLYLQLVSMNLRFSFTVIRRTIYLWRSQSILFTGETETLTPSCHIQEDELGAKVCNWSKTFVDRGSVDEP